MQVGDEDHFLGQGWGEAQVKFNPDVNQIEDVVPAGFEPFDSKMAENG